MDLLRGLWVVAALPALMIRNASSATGMLGLSFLFSIPRCCNGLGSWLMIEMLFIPENTYRAEEKRNKAQAKSATYDENRVPFNCTTPNLFLDLKPQIPKP